MEQQDIHAISNEQLNYMEAWLFASHHEHLGKIVREDILDQLLREASDEIEEAKQAKNAYLTGMWQILFAKHRRQKRYLHEKERNPLRGTLWHYKQNHLKQSATFRALQDLISNVRTKFLNVTKKPAFTAAVKDIIWGKLRNDDFPSQLIVATQAQLIDAYEIDEQCSNDIEEIDNELSWLYGKVFAKDFLPIKLRASP